MLTCLVLKISKANQRVKTLGREKRYAQQTDSESRQV